MLNIQLNFISFKFIIQISHLLRNKEIIIIIKTHYKIIMLSRAVQTHPRPDPPGGSDRRPIRNRPTRSFRRSEADLGFQNPKTAGRLAGFLFKTRRNPTEPRSQHFPAKLFTSGEISAISGDISARSMESSLDLARSH